MNHKKNAPGMVAVSGAPSVLVVLVCLCLAALSVLSLIAARNESVLAERTVSQTTLYYQADAEATAILAALLDEFTQTGQITQKEGISLAEPEQTESLENSKNIAFSADYSVPCGENSELHCFVMVFRDGSYDILTWKRVYTAEQVFFDDSVNIWDGN